MVIKVGYAEMQEATASIKSISGAIDSKLDRLRTGLQRLVWDGSDREAYNMHQKEWDTAVTDMNNILNQISVAMGAATQNYMDTESANRNLWG